MIEISVATAAGIPCRAVCTECQQSWDRPYDDPDGATFRPWVRIHLRTGRNVHDYARALGSAQTLTPAQVYAILEAWQGKDSTA
jgi:hypothetical protein